MISIVVVCDENYGIGYENKLLCHLPGDLKNFKSLTKEGVVVMGRKTWESIGSNPLPNRYNKVVSSKPVNHSEMMKGDCMWCNNIEASLDPVCFDSGVGYFRYRDIFIIGGGSIYKQSINFCNKIYLSRIKNRFENVDTYFPNLHNLQGWVKESDKDMTTDLDSFKWSLETWVKL